MIKSIGVYCLSVWFTSTLLILLVDYVYTFHISNIVITLPIDAFEAVFQRWIFEVVPYMLLRLSMGLPFFILFCIILHKIFPSENLIKLTLTLSALCYGVHIYYNIEDLKYVSNEEQFIFQFVKYCITSIICIWVFKIRNFENLVGNGDIWDS